MQVTSLACSRTHGMNPPDRLSTDPCRNADGAGLDRAGSVNFLSVTQTLKDAIRSSDGRSAAGIRHNARLISLDTSRLFACEGHHNCIEFNLVGSRKTHVIKTLKLIVALASAALIIGQVGTERWASREPKVMGLPMSLNVEPWQVVVRACGNCHSNHTDWPWYSRVPPVSWWIAQHVREGRERFNFSEWDTYSQSQRQDKLESMCGLILTGRMPPWQYTAMHPEARLTEKDKKAVCAWVEEVTASK